MKRMTNASAPAPAPDPTPITTITLPIDQFFLLIIAIVGAAVGILIYIHRQVHNTEINNLKRNLERAEDDIDYIMRVNDPIGHSARRENEERHQT